MAELFEKQTYTVKIGMDDALKEFAERYAEDYDNKSHVLRCAIITFFREQRKKGRFINQRV